MESSNPLIDISFYLHDISACCCIATVNTKLLDEQRIGPLSKVRDNAQCSQ